MKLFYIEIILLINSKSKEWVPAPTGVFIFFARTKKTNRTCVCRRHVNNIRGSAQNIFRNQPSSQALI